MNFLVREIKKGDLDQVLDLAKQFSLLNLPADKSIISQKIEHSRASFAGEVSKEKAEYVFVVEEVETGYIAGSSQLVAKHGTEDEPSYSFKVLKKERFSKGLGLGFIHQILRLHINENGPTEVGGLVVGKSYRGRPEKVGKLTSLSRFAYIGLNPTVFDELLYAQMAPPLTEDGRSDFWEALGRRFTGMPYHEADLLSQKNKEFIRSLFPEEDVYLCLLDAKARLALGRVGQETQAALHMLEKIGFKYNHEVDPFDGGPHVSCPLKEVSLIKNSKRLKVVEGKNILFNEPALIGVLRGSEFMSGFSPYHIDGENVVLPEKTRAVLNLSNGEEVFLTLLEE